MDDYLETVAGSEADGVSVHTGFPNPALDYRGRKRPLALDLNQLLIRSPSSCFFFRISGHHWADQGLHDGDIAVIDRSLPAQSGDLVVTWETSGFLICRWLANPGLRPWGVITSTIHQFKR